MNSYEKWIFKYKKSEDADCRIFFFHHAGGTIDIYRNWGKLLLDKADICLVQLPMRANRIKEELPDSIEELANDFIEDCIELFDKPFVIFGHSMGAQLAYEAARKLTLKGIDPLALFVSGCSSPNINSKIFDYENALYADEDILLEILKSYDHMLDNEVLKDRDFLDYYLPIVRKDFYLSDSYKKEKKKTLNCDVHILYSENDIHVKKDYLRDWKEYTIKDSIYTCYDGNHFYLEEEDNRLDICNRINEVVKKVIE